MLFSPIRHRALRRTLRAKEAILDTKVPPARPFPLGRDGVALTYDHEGREVSPGNRGASLAPIGEGPHATVFRARTPQGDIALKVQKEKAPRTNSKAQARFAREHELLDTLGGEEPGLVELLPVPGFAPQDGPPNFEPLFLCREMGALFHLPCPRCLRMHTLSDCRRDEVLQWAGLPTYSTTGERFLWCEACGPEKPEFYARKERRGPMPVKDFVSLVRDLKTAVDRGADETPLAAEIVDGLKAGFPCVSCQHRAACYPREAGSRGLAEARLTPVSMNEFHAWPIPLCPLNYEEAADLLSGAGPQGLLAVHGKSWPTPAIRRLKEEAAARCRLADPARALALKLDFFAQVVQSVHRLHAQSGKPHLGISPAHILAQVPDDGSLLARLVAPGAPEPQGGLCLPPPEPKAPFAPAAQLDDAFGRAYPVRIHVEKVWSKEGKETFMSARVHGEGLPSDRVSDKDEVRLALNVPGWIGREIRGRPMTGEQTSGGSGVLGVITEPVDLDPVLVNDLKAARGQAPLFGTATIQRNFGIPFDVHALGMLLFRCLLVNEHQTFARVVEEFVEPLRASLELSAATRPGATLDVYKSVLLGELAHEPYLRLADRRNIWFKPSEADAERIPAEAWADLLTVGFQAVAHIKGFSFCESDRDETGGEPGRPTLSMLGELESIGARVAAMLAPAAAPEESVVVEVAPLGPEEAAVEGPAPPGASARLKELEARVAELQAAQSGLFEAWNRIYEGVVGIPDKTGAPLTGEDARIALIAATAAESIECINQVFRGFATMGGDEVGESVPKIRMLLQDAIMATQKGENAKDRLDKITRRFRALQMTLYGLVTTFVEAHSYSTKMGTKNLLDVIDQKLFELISKGKKGKEPDYAELKERYAQIREPLAERHSRVFQPFFQEYVRQKLTKLQ